MPNGHAMAQTVIHWPIAVEAKVRSQAMPGSVGFVVDRFALGLMLSECFGSPIIVIPVMLIRI